MPGTPLIASGAVETIASFVLIAFVYLLTTVVPFLLFLQAMYWLLTLPMRRNERCRLYLDLLDLGLKQGRTPEAATVDMADSRDPVLGKPLLEAAEHVRQGMRLSQALYLAPRLAPPQVRAMLKTGERIGDAGKVLPACRLLLKDSVSQVRGALNYLIVLSVIGIPFTIFVPLTLKVKVLPAFQQVFLGMFEGGPLPAFTRFVFAENSWLVGIQVTLFAAVWLTALVYLGGPRLKDLLEDVFVGTGWIDWVALRLPWRRKRLQRDFSAMLAVLLESGVPEIEAVRLAAESTSNWVVRRRADQACAQLEKGGTLPQALECMGEAAELQWRLANALRRGSGFSEALAGWQEALDAKAFQLEQSAAQLATTILVLINGALVAAFVIAMFIPLIQLINRAALW